MAETILARRAAIMRTSHAKDNGLVLAVGDSWFDYPLYDILKKLEDEHGYTAASAAHAGQAVEAMASQGGQIDQLARLFEKVAALGQVPKAILVSGGGNDIAGKEFGMLLNNATSPIGGWNAEILDGLIQQRIATAYRTLIAAIQTVAQYYLHEELPVVVHGYDYPVPDGRGVLGGFWVLPGPWLEPGFHEKRFEDLAMNVKLMHDIIDRFNAMLTALVRDPAFANVHYIDLRGTLKTQLAGDVYKQTWGNELHPTEAGFSTIANRFASELAKL